MRIFTIFKEIPELNHTIYKNHFVVCLMAVCGCMRVCDTSLEPSWTPYERIIGAFCELRAARPQFAKMRFLLHKAAINGRSIYKNHFVKGFLAVCGCGIFRWNRLGHHMNV